MMGGTGTHSRKAPLGALAVAILGLSIGCSSGATNQDSGKEITAFTFASPACVGKIDETAKTIDVEMPSGTKINALVPTVSHTGISVSPDSGVAHDFSSPSTYTVKAGDGSSQSYIVTVLADELVKNGDFSQGKEDWNHWANASTGATATALFSNGTFRVIETRRGVNNWDWNLSTRSVDVKKGVKYRVSFDASSSIAEEIRVGVYENGTDVNYDGNSYTEWDNHYFTISATTQTYTYAFTMNAGFDDPSAALIFYLGQTRGYIEIDNVSMKVSAL